jgi:hypothetical protein
MHIPLRHSRKPKRKYRDYINLNHGIHGEHGEDTGLAKSRPWEPTPEDLSFLYNDALIKSALISLIIL